MPTVLWWGRADRDYSRNRFLLSLFSDLKWTVDFFHPLSSLFGRAEAYIHPPKKPDMVWVPCFRHTDIAAASHWASKWKVPLVIDPLISAYEKDVFEKKKWREDSKKAKKRRQWETACFAKADRVIADTPAHADFFQTFLGVDPDKLSVLYVGADTDMFRPTPAPPPVPPFEILFYGSFIHLQGTEVIIEAARLTTDLDAVWVLLGEGDLKKEAIHRAQELPNVRFESWIDYEKLPARVAQAHILLGIFGTTLKSGLVIPNKLFQAMAGGKPVITRKSQAFSATLNHAEPIGWVDAGNPVSLANCVRTWLKTPQELADRGNATRILFDTFFSKKIQVSTLETILTLTKRV